MATRYQPGVRVSEYVLEECLGAGTFGEVWQARHHVWQNDRVAVKLPTEPEYVRYLQREGVVVHGVRHPNIVRVIGLDPYAETPYLVMELVKGPSLKQVIAEHPKGLDIDVAVVVLRGLLHGVGAAHGANIVHRDLKPGNVLLHLDGRPLAALTVDDVKIGDFGLGVADPDTLRSIVLQSASIDREAQSGEVAGTLAYMAPEQRDGGQAPTSRSDLYAIGVMLYEMLTGERPAGAELPSTLRATVPAALDEVFRRLYTRLDRRYESAAAVLDDLDARLAAARGPVTGAGARPARKRTFAYEAVEPSGQNFKGEIEAADVGEAVAKLKNQGYTPSRVWEQPADQHAAGSGRTTRHTHVQCPACHHAVEPEDQFCTSCGVQLAERVPRCPSCGGYPGPHDRFCIFCGTVVALAGE